MREQGAMAHRLKEVLRLLSALDDNLVKALRDRDIRLLRASFVLKQPPNFRLPWRQELERMERDGESPSPLLSPDEAVELIRECSSSTGALTYGWLSPGDPDPAGCRLDVLQRALRKHPHIRACFWDFGSLFQVPTDTPMPEH